MCLAGLMLAVPLVVLALKPYDASLLVKLRLESVRRTGDLKWHD
jgi:hypothetical protein